MLRINCTYSRKLLWSVFVQVLNPYKSGNFYVLLQLYISRHTHILLHLRVYVCMYAHIHTHTHIYFNFPLTPFIYFPFKSELEGNPVSLPRRLDTPQSLTHTHSYRRRRTRQTQSHTGTWNARKSSYGESRLRRKDKMSGRRRSAG